MTSRARRTRKLRRKTPTKLTPSLTRIGKKTPRTRTKTQMVRMRLIRYSKRLIRLSLRTKTSRLKRTSRIKKIKKWIKQISRSRTMRCKISSKILKISKTNLPRTTKTKLAKPMTRATTFCSRWQTSYKSVKRRNESKRSKNSSVSSKRMTQTKSRSKNLRWPQKSRTLLIRINNLPKLMTRT